MAKYTNNLQRNFFSLKIILKAKSASEALFLRSRHFFRLHTHINGMASSMSLWPLWTYCYKAHIRDIAAIEAIVDSDHWYGCLKKHLDLRIGASEADYALRIILYGQN